MATTIETEYPPIDFNGRSSDSTTRLVTRSNKARQSQLKKKRNRLIATASFRISPTRSQTDLAHSQHL